ncbi:hypothetical protein POV27_18460 [Aureisphaera galaxeae]|uniref:hypothetical protein n=1 Tax=Aureisphaera galaxeae TaxID=1538023 RepID=UPI002350BC62|nr:hypothetical protein [Aureisphaera galaxeae]MDC8006041.1 hypothetical protein [Aureisphaera galaxeae]
MKKLFPLVLLAFFAVFVSCESETLETETNSLTSKNVDLTTKKENRFSASDTLQHRLQWTSFLCAQVLLHNHQLRDEFETHIDGKGRVSLKALFAVDIGEENHFRNKFTDYLSHYIEYGDGHPDSQEDTPGFPVVPGGGNQFSPLTVAERVDIFFDYILTENCIEIYVPNTLFDITDFDRIVSTAHPLSRVSTNDGFRHIICRSAEYCTFTAITFPTDIETNNILIARPIRDLSDSNCNYLEYPVAEFTNFYNQH